jgi:hypothetical protein
VWDWDHLEAVDAGEVVRVAGVERQAVQSATAAIIAS